MYVERLKLSQFKCFPTCDVRLGKITLILGANSTGKSSLLQALLAALQSDQYPLTFSPNGELADLGDFRSMSHRRRINQEVGVAIDFADSPLIGKVSLEGNFKLSKKTGLPELVHGVAASEALRLEIKHQGRFKVRWEYDQEKDTFLEEFGSSEELRQLFTASTRFRYAKGETSDRSRRSAKTSELTFAPLPPTGGLALSSPREIYRRLASPRHVLIQPHLSALTGFASNFLRTFNYIGSFRLEPSRTYLQQSKLELKVGRTGSNYIDQIMHWQRERDPRLAKVLSAMKRLKLLSSIRSTHIGGGVAQIKVRTAAMSKPASITDVGFGVSQLLPILVADVQLPKGGTLAVSQPEIHLHPSAQADLAEYFAKRSIRDQMHYILETHSEYFLHRIRLLVVRGELKEEDVSVIYMTNNGLSTTAHAVNITRDGKIVGAPKEFFETYMLDVMNIAMESTSD